MKQNKPTLEHAEELVAMAQEEYDRRHLAHAQVLLEAAASMYELEAQWHEARRCLEAVEKVAAEQYRANGTHDTKAIVNLMTVQKRAAAAVRSVQRGALHDAQDALLEVHEHAALASEALDELFRSDERETVPFAMNAARRKRRGRDQP